MYEDTKVPQLVINQLSEEKFKELLENDELDQNQLYMTDDRAGYTPPLLSTLWSDHAINDMSWLCADTFSWQSGDVYVAAYNHLVSCMADATEETETIDGIEITYHLAQNKRKICLPDQEDKILELYNKTGIAWYYILDEDNTQFKLPRSKHNKYADTVPVVGNGMALGITNGQISRAIGAVTVHDSQTTTALMLSRNEPNNLAVDSSVTIQNSSGNDLGTGKAYGVATTPDSSGLIAQQEQDTDQYKYLYFYVGNFERDAVEQTAGVTTETLNGKADSDLGNIPANYDYVVESQEPAAENGYTWYRKYKSGWVEQGGRTATVAGQITPYTLPVVMANTEYTITATSHLMHTSNASSVNFVSIDTTSFSAWSNIFGTTGYHAVPFSWFVSGMSAQ